VSKYHFKKNYKNRRRKITKIAIFSAVGIVVLVAIIGYDLYRNRFHAKEGPANTIVQPGALKTQKTIDEKLYSFKLPTDWKEIRRGNAPTDNSVTWQASLKDADNRFLQIYVDTIPSLAVNMELPVTAVDNGLNYGDLSDNCVSFTKGGSFESSVAIRSKETAAKWQEVDFICDLPKPEYGVIGTGSKDGINTVKVAGPTGGMHKYFFVYTDRNVKVDYSIFYDALTSFRAK